MNTLRSHFNQFCNKWPIIKHKLRIIHETLLECLGEENISMGRQDYKPGKVHLIEKNVWNGTSILSRLMVSRYGVDIYRSDLPFPEERILATSGGGYQLIEWLAHQTIEKKIHLPYRQVPAVLEKFAHQYDGAEKDSRIQFSLITE